MKASKLRNVLSTLLMLTCLGHPQQSDAVAYCALRDPVEAIRFLYPHADGHRSIVRAIDSSTREQILNLLSFSLHFNELGKHTLYTILNGTTAIGFVHVRSEPASWGLMEIAWALDPDLTVKNFMFQRCRSEDCSAQTIEKMLSVLADKSIDELRTYLTDDGQSLHAEIAQNLKIDNTEFVAAVVRSALKTIAVTQETWGDIVHKIRHDQFVKSTFDKQHIDVARISIDSDALHALKSAHNGGGSLLETSSAETYKISVNRKTVGYSAAGQWRDNYLTRTTLWAFDQNGNIVATHTVPKFFGKANENSFSELEGLNVSVSENCSTASQLMGHDLFFLARYNDN